MADTSSWNWEAGKRVVCDSGACADQTRWLEEPYASPDGERIVQVACTDDAEFGLCENGKLGEERWEKIVCPRFSPENKYTAHVFADMEYTIAVDSEAWEETYGFTWGTRFAGGHVAVGVQQDMKYGMSVDGTIWETLYDNANNFAISADGSRTAAAVQVESMGQADIFKFQSGIFSVAVDGQAWDNRFVNVWTPVFSADGNSVAVQVRRSLYDYSIAVDGKCWQNFNCVWEPAFNPADGSVVAPVRVGGKWGMCKDNEMFWQPHYLQCWQQQFSPDGKNLFAIVATGFGKFTVAKNDVAWAATAPVVMDLTLSPDGERAAAITKDKNAYGVMVDGKVWSASYDRVFPPVFSPDGRHVACRVIKGGRWGVVVNGKAWKEDFDKSFDPVFSPESDKVLIKGVAGGEYSRTVASINEF